MADTQTATTTTPTQKVKPRTDLGWAKEPPIPPKEAWKEIQNKGYLMRMDPGPTQTVRIEALYQGPDHSPNKDQPLRWYCILEMPGFPAITNKDTIRWSLDGVKEGWKIDQTNYVSSTTEGGISAIIFKADNDLTS